MSETVKLIIEIPKKEYELVKELKAINIGGRGSGKGIIYACLNAIKKGTPLDDVKAEIGQIYQEIDTVSHNEYENAVEQGKEIAYENVLSILDNIGKGNEE